MLELYKYLYYKLYTWNLKMWGVSDGPEFNASLGIAFLMGLQASILLVIVDIFLSYKYKYYDLLSAIPIIVLIGIMLFFIAITFFSFVYKKKYLKLIERYKKETNKTRLRKTIKVWLFVFLTVFMFFLMAYFDKKVMGS